MRLRHGQKFVEQLRGYVITCRTDVSPTFCSAAIDAPSALAIVGLGNPDRRRALVGSRTHATDVRRHRCRSTPSCGFDKKERNNDRSQDRNA
jgi:hypothetical protein